MSERYDPYKNHFNGVYQVLKCLDLISLFSIRTKPPLNYRSACISTTSDIHELFRFAGGRKTDSVHQQTHVEKYILLEHVLSVD